jgi:hypothetical protein
MFYLPTICLALIARLLTSTHDSAEPFAIDLEVRAAKASATAHAEAAGRKFKPKTRSVLEAKAGQQIVVRWTLRRTAAKDVVKDVVAHFYVAREEKVGQQAVPDLSKEVAVESALSMDFKPQGTAQGKLSFAIEKPGCYLLRLETIGAVVTLDSHESYAALDLVIR